MELNSIEEVANARQPVLGVFKSHAADETVNVIPLREKQLGEIGAVLARDSGNERLSRQGSPPTVSG